MPPKLIQSIAAELQQFGFRLCGDGYFNVWLTADGHFVTASGHHTDEKPDNGLPRNHPNANAQTPTRYHALLVGQLASGWAAFTESPEFQDGEANPLDRYSQRVCQQIATLHNGRVIMPNDGPPYPPFIEWAITAEALTHSPLGLLIHPTFGLWHAYRACILIPKSDNQANQNHLFPIDSATTLDPMSGHKTSDETISDALTTKRSIQSSVMDDAAANHPPQLSQTTQSPCQGCGQPCLSGCPVNAFSKDNGYDVMRCKTYLANTDAPCHQHGCLARVACPVGQPYEYSQSHKQFLMRAFSS